MAYFKISKYRFLNILIPTFLKKKIYFNVRRSFLNSLKKQSDEIPKYQINMEFLAFARLLPTREVMLEKLPKGGIVAELGVDIGTFSEKILEINRPKILYLVDAWDTNRYNHYKHDTVKEKFRKKIEKGEVKINVGLSTEVVKKFPDESFDWIYIDTDHSYGLTKKELQLWSSKIKPGGIIAGHDYIIGNWNGLIRYGVIEAVHEFCVLNNWEIIFLTMELSISPSFAIRKKI